MERINFIDVLRRTTRLDRLRVIIGYMHQFANLGHPDRCGCCGRQRVFHP